MSHSSITESRSQIQYDGTFFKYTDRMARQSAETVVGVVGEMLPIKSVADFGCGNGNWISAWRGAGVSECIGIDGDYVNRRMLCIDESDFVAADLQQPVRLDRQFDLVQSLEVAEHLPKRSAETFVDTLVSHGKVILFSAAVPGQGGMYHVNEQPYKYWRAMLNSRGYEMLDAVRPHIQHEPDVQPWYRFNTFLFVHREVLPTLSDELVNTHLPGGSPIPDHSPTMYRARKAIVRLLPVSVVNQLSTLNSRWVQWKNK